MSYQSLKLEHQDDFLIVQMDHGKVNAINTVLSQDLLDVFTKYADDPAVKGIILAGRPHCFSAGLDVVAMASGGEEGAIKFWRAYLGALQAMIRYPKPLIAAITGYAPAGGTIMALCADYRIMGRGDKHKMGMNEFKMSLYVPEMMADIYAYHLGEKYAWESIQQARMFSADEAKEWGLVNMVVEVEEVMDLSVKCMRKSTQLIPATYIDTKRYLRKGLLKIADRSIDDMLVDITANIKSPETQMMMQMFMAQLKG